MLGGADRNACGTTAAIRIAVGGILARMGLADTGRSGSPGVQDSAEEWRSLSRRGQLVSLRRVGRAALAAHGLGDARLTLLSDQYNTTFRVEARGGPYVLRISRPQVHTAETIESEMAWLGALGRETDLGVPEPVRSRNGSFVVLAGDVARTHTE